MSIWRCGLARLAGRSQGSVAFLMGVVHSGVWRPRSGDQSRYRVRIGVTGANSKDARWRRRYRLDEKSREAGPGRFAFVLQQSQPKAACKNLIASCQKQKTPKTRGSNSIRAQEYLDLPIADF